MKKVMAVILSIVVLVCFGLFAMASSSSSRPSVTTAAESTTAATTTEATTTTTEATTTTTAAPEDDDDEDTGDATEDGEEGDDADGVDPDLKKFLESYEAYIDAYIDFMLKMNENPDDITIIAEYGDMMVKYAEFAEAIEEYDEKYDNEEMSDADMKYYLEVMTRIDKKLIDASLSLPTT